MQTDEKQIFRFNWQVGVVIAVTMVMLIIPLAGVAVLVNYLVKPKKEIAMGLVEPPFRKPLEDIANKELGSKTSLTDEGKTGSVETERSSSEVEGLAKAFGGYALVSEDGTRLRVQLPGNQVEDFRRACLDRAVAPLAKPRDDTRVLVEVVIKTKSS